MYLVELFGEGRLIFQFVQGQLLKPFQSGTVIGLGKHHVETQQRGVLAIQQFFHQLSQPVATPRPATYVRQAFFVNVHNDDALVQRFGHGGAKAGVVKNVVESLQNINAKRPDGVQHCKNERNQRDGDARPVPEEKSHKASWRGALQRFSGQRRENTRLNAGRTAFVSLPTQAYRRS